jgi:uncharacterized damage-inducible protein DinB
MVKSTQQPVIITFDEMLAHWQGHRALTRRVIEAFPEDKLFSFSIGGMRPFGEMCQELLKMGAPAARGIATGTWGEFGDIDGSPLDKDASTKEEVLKMWDWSTEKINEYWEQIGPNRFQEVDNAYGQWEGKTWWHLMYMIDNEVHHRGQAYVYLRALDIEPPQFWER